MLTPSALFAAPQPHDGSLGDPDILYVGRWDRSDPADFHGYWSNVYLRTRFTGTSVGIKLDGGTRLDVSIDNEPFREMDAGSGVTALNTAPLKPGVHALLVGSAGQNYEVGFQGLTLDPGAKTLPRHPAPDHRVRRRLHHHRSKARATTPGRPGPCSAATTRRSPSAAWP